ncbi:head-tail connector protein [Phenylobacterium sp.]|uniref:head-tail connector protein n=1 Tax=Phenylobacterium sp. TaxID=1871053 RepID=UPI00392408F3
MIVSVVTAPQPVVELVEAKDHLRVDHDDSDDLIAAYVQAATAHIDGPDGWLGRALGVQTLEARLDAFPCGELIALPYRPLTEIVSIKYDDGDGAERTVDADLYTLDPAGALLAYGAAWPVARTRRGAVRVRYVAGYANGIPAPIKAAILLMVGDLFANRETVGAAAARIQMTTTVESLLAPFRVWSL